MRKLVYFVNGIEVATLDNAKKLATKLHTNYITKVVEVAETCKVNATEREKRLAYFRNKRVTV